MLKKLFGRKSLNFPEATITPRSEHNISRANINSNALKVLYTLKDAGFSAYLVGGGVRDLLLELHPKDFDVVTNAQPEEIKPLFRRCLLIGRRFRLAHVYFGREMVEVATFRAAQNSKSNSTQQHSQHGMLLRDNVYGTIVEDVWRRDFTVNALYYNIENFSVVDYCNGMADLRNKILRIIGDPDHRYHEDPVRLLRAVRLAAKLDFQIETNTEAPLKKLAPLLQHVPPARLFDEVIKLFHSGKALPTLKLLRHYQLLEQLFPQTADAIKNDQHADALLTLVCQTTDDRINSGKHVSAAFLFAGILWYPFQTKATALAESNSWPIALHSAAHKIISAQTKLISIPRRFSSAMREIWELQPRLENCFLKQIHRLAGHPRLRAAYDFLVLRAEASKNQNLVKCADWWTKFLVADEQERQLLLAELPKQPKHRRRKRRPKH